MKVAELLDTRRDNWRQLEGLCVQMEGRGRRRLGGAGTARFAALYRAACADLALADAYNLPTSTVTYLHRLVARAHNQLYRSRRFDFAQWGHELFHEVPRRLRRDNCLRAALLIFWGLFFAALLFGRHSPEFLNSLIGKDQLESVRDMYSQQLDRENASVSGAMNGFYIQHNVSIGLECFAWGLLFGVGGLVDLAFNAVQLGSIFGYMTTVPEWHNFSQFVTAHGPFELTAIAVSAAAGMRLGFSMINTHGLSRIASLQQAGREAMPTMGAAMVMLAIAAMIEAFLSPSAAPYAVKASVAVVSSVLLFFYIFVLGRPPRDVSDSEASTTSTTAQEPTSAA
jgi:uncharacterized membrane protein SpoIIM required for sporulation